MISSVRAVSSRSRYSSIVKYCASQLKRAYLATPPTMNGADNNVAYEQKEKQQVRCDAQVFLSITCRTGRHHHRSRAVEGYPVQLMICRWNEMWVFEGRIPPNQVPRTRVPETSELRWATCSRTRAKTFCVRYKAFSGSEGCIQEVMESSRVRGDLDAPWGGLGHIET